jgi:endonuclease/exonuclease/phosphatase family metal-dependent hydrolase
MMPLCVASITQSVVLRVVLDSKRWQNSTADCVDFVASLLCCSHARRIARHMANIQQVLPGAVPGGSIFAGLAPLVVITSNACLYSSAQVSAMATFLAEQHADVVFVQEANGYMAELLDALRGKPGFDAAVMDLTTHILLRHGRFLSLAAQWPYCFFSRVRLAGYPSDILLVNLHLCEHEWSTGSDAEEQRYRVQYLQRIFAHLQSLPDAGSTALIVGGDFNAFAHQDQSLYLPASPSAAADAPLAIVPSLCGEIKLLSGPDAPAVYERMYRRHVFSTLTLSQAGLTDCWRACHPGSRSLLESQGVSFLSWPVAAAAIEHDENLPAEIEGHEVAGRIDFLFVNARVRTLSCVMTHKPRGWYSDHLAVVAHLSIDSMLAEQHIESSVLAPHGAAAAAAPPSPSLSMRLVLPAPDADPASPPQWLLSAAGLSGGKNHYIEIVRSVTTDASCDVAELKEPNTTSCGWFYVDGLQNAKDCSVATSQQYLYGSFEPLKPVDPVQARFHAKLFDDTQMELISVEVQIQQKQRLFHVDTRTHDICSAFP